MLGYLSCYKKMMLHRLLSFLSIRTLNSIQPYFQVGIVRLKQPENLGPGHEETRYIIMVLCPSKEKVGHKVTFLTPAVFNAKPRRNNWK